MTPPSSTRTTATALALGWTLVAAAGAAQLEGPAPDEASLRRTAVSLAGTPYRPCGRRQARGLDATRLVARMLDLDVARLPANDGGWALAGLPVKLEDLGPGDLLLVAAERDDKAPTPGLFLGGHDFIFVSSETGKVRLLRLDEPPWQGRVVAARRLLRSPCATAKSPDAGRPTETPHEAESQVVDPVHWRDLPATEEPGPTCGPPAAKRSKASRSPGVEVGIASYYGKRDGRAGRRTASGERHGASAMTAAHRTLPFGTLLNVTNLANGRRVVVRVNDRGPHVRGRILDLSDAAARKLGFYGRGLARVRAEVVQRRTG